MKKLLPVIALVFLAFVVVLAVNNSHGQTLSESATPAPKYTVQIGDTTVMVEIADTPEKMALGLGERDSLAQNEGMLFPYGRKTPTVFWMKGMRFPLDIVWIADGKVVQITENAPPEPGVTDLNLKKYLPNELVDNVLEVNAGFAARNNIKVGDSFSVN